MFQQSFDKLEKEKKKKSPIRGQPKTEQQITYMD